MMAAINPEKIVIARPFGQRAQAIVSYRDQHLIVGADSINSTTGERTRPADLILASLATDATFICQAEAETMGISLYALTASVGWIEIAEGGFAAPTPTAGIPIPAALKTDDPEATRPMPRVLLRSTLGAAVRLTLAFAGPTQEQSARLVEAVKVQSSVYRLLTCATTVEIVLEGE
jgi:uncharacterized OsmC-like protein